MAAAEMSLKDLAQHIGLSVGRPLGEFKMAADSNSKVLSKIVKDISGMFSAQRKDISGMSEAIQDSVEASRQAASKSDATNTLLQDSINIQSTIASEMKNMVAFTRSLNTLMFQMSYSGTNNNTIFGTIANSLTGLPSALGTALKGMGLLAGGAAIGAGVGNMLGGGSGGGAGAGKVESHWWTPERQKHAVETLQKQAGLSEMGAAGLVARWAGVESAGGPASVNPSSGAFGIGQWLGGREKGIAGNTDFDAQLTHAANELNTTEKAAAEVLRNAKTAEEAARGASMYERAEGYNKQTGIDNFTAKTPVQDVYNRVSQNAGATETKGGVTPQTAPTQTTTETTEKKKTEDAKMTSGGSSDAKKFLQEREAGAQGNVGVNSDKLDQTFATKMAAAIQAAEKATGSKVRITEGYRDPHVQAQYYSDYIGKPITYDGKTYQPNPAKFGRLAAPPGQSKHQRGMAVDMAESPAREWIRAHADQFGLRQLGSKDMPHFELAGASAQASTSPVAYSVGEGTGVTPSTGGGGGTGTAGGEQPEHPIIASLKEKYGAATSYLESFAPQSVGSMAAGGLAGAAMGAMSPFGMSGALVGAGLGAGFGSQVNIPEHIKNFAEPLFKIPTPYIGEAPPPPAEILPGTAESIAGQQINQSAIENLAMDHQSRAKMLELLTKKEAHDAETLHRQHHEGQAMSWDYNNPNDIEWPDWASMIGGNHWEEMKKIKKNMW